MNFRFLASHRFVVLIAAGLFVLGSYTRSLQGVEKAVYDAGTYLMSGADLSTDVAVVAIDDQSLQRVGPWPWSRDRIAGSVDQLRRFGARAVGLMIPLERPETPAGLPALVEQAASSKSLAAAAKRWAARLDTDRELMRALTAAGNVAIAADYSEGPSAVPMPLSLSGQALKASGSGWSARLLSPLLVPPSRPGVTVRSPLDMFVRAAAAVGLNQSQRDGDWRRSVPLVVGTGEASLPGFVAQVAALSLGRSPADLSLRPGLGLEIGTKFYRTDPDLNYLPLPPRRGDEVTPVAVYPLADLWSDEKLARRLRNKTVLVGFTAASLAPRFRGPAGSEFTPVTWAAFSLGSLLAGSSVTVPSWFYGLQRGLILLLVAYLWLLPPRLHGRGGLLLGLLLSLVMLNAGLGVLLARHLWLPLALPAVFLLSTHLLLAARRTVEARLTRDRTEAAEARRLLAASLRALGRLDEAFEQLRRCPKDEAALEPLYELGREYERRRQFDLAASIYGYAGEIHPAYRDIDERQARLKPWTSAVRRPAGAGVSVNETVVMDDPQLETTKVAHYQLEQELGKGAMGVVFLATDLKLGRKIALKTLALTEEFEGEALKDAEQRFTREAQAAGRLNHSNIVTIHEAGQDRDLAYIAMDYAEGDSLEVYTDADNLLPVNEVLEIGMQVASALDYAHGQQVVHRDIKPSNVIYNREQGTVKITDFGIARLVDDSRTRTGVLLGTPSYMSPEQATAKKVDGRSDLFSLAVTLYQLLTGRLPFVGDSLGNLVYRIATARHEPIAKVRPGLSANLSRVINRGLQKEADKRFPTGKAMGEALRRCRQRVQEEGQRRLGG